MTDLDGTLLNDEHVLAPETVEACRKVVASGNTFVIASGRHYVDIVGVRSVLGIRAYAISSNGARVHDPDDCVVFEQNLDSALARSILAAPRPESLIASVFTSKDWLVDRPAPELLAYHRHSGFTYRVEPLQAHCEGVAKLEFMGNPAALLDFERQLHAHHAGLICTTFSLPICLEITAPGVSKGAALTALMQRLDFERHRVIAFGDNLNDIEMLQVAGNPHIMGNAHARLLDLFPDATRIGRNTDGAVASTLRSFFDCI